MSGRHYEASYKGVREDRQEATSCGFCCEAAGEPVSAKSFTEAALTRPRVDRKETTSHKSSRNGVDIDHIVVHYTTSRNIDGTISHFKSGSPSVSAHYIVGRDGELVQMVPDNERAWHAGNSDMNARSIGIEHVAADGDKITDAQSLKSIALIRWLMAEYGIPLDNIIPHVCIKPTSCCGDLFKDFGGGADFPCSKQKAALHRWLDANGVNEVQPDEAPTESLGRTASPERTALELIETTAGSTVRLAMAQAIVNFEARRDPKGKIKVYLLPSVDGGGDFEVAGINERYNHDEAWTLRRLIEADRQDEAERLACEYVAQYTDRAASWCHNPGVEFYLRDCTFNRGPGGAAKILQRALHVSVDGLVGPKTKSAVATAEANPQALLKSLRQAREAYEREDVGYRGIFWQGLVNRWNNALKKAQEFLA